MAQRDLITIAGLREFNRSLRRVDSELPKGLKAAGNAAAQIVVGAARPLVPLGPARGGHARDSIKVASTRTAARVSAGGKRWPYYAWLDFGGRVGPGKSVQRPFLKSGRYIWKAFDDHREEIQGVLQRELADLARRAGLDVER